MHQHDHDHEHDHAQRSSSKHKNVCGAGGRATGVASVHCPQKGQQHERASSPASFAKTCVIEAHDAVPDLSGNC